MVQLWEKKIRSSIQLFMVLSIKSETRGMLFCLSFWEKSKSYSSSRGHVAHWKTSQKVRTSGKPLWIEIRVVFINMDIFRLCINFCLLPNVIVNISVDIIHTFTIFPTFTVFHTFSSLNQNRNYLSNQFGSNTSFREFKNVVSDRFDFLILEFNFAKSLIFLFIVYQGLLCYYELHGVNYISY